ncbi:MAG: hypothetical protein F6J96_15900 [Symploca sp. SIO1C2]|nr:hypothetical protein [Symploca sp. SIO1C2]
MKHIRFDWAIKKLLRDKANYGILEGFISELLGQTVKIQSILESESNPLMQENKFNRVDILARSTQGELLLIEVQNDSGEESAVYKRYLQDKQYEKSIISTTKAAAELEGRKKEKRDIAIAMKQAGSDLEFIAQITGLSLREVELITRTPIQ